MGIWSDVIIYAVGVIVVVGGLILLFKEQVVVDQHGNILDVKVAGGHFKSRSAALVVLLLGVFFFAGPPLAKKYLGPPLLHISGKILLQDGTRVAGIGGATVGILPAHTHTVGTVPDGSYFIDVPKNSEGELYEVLVHVNASPQLFVLAVVSFDSRGQGTFDYTFHKE